MRLVTEQDDLFSQTNHCNYNNYIAFQAQQWPMVVVEMLCLLELVTHMVKYGSFIQLL